MAKKMAVRTMVVHEAVSRAEERRSPATAEKNTPIASRTPAPNAPLSHRSSRATESTEPNRYPREMCHGVRMS